MSEVIVLDPAGVAGGIRQELAITDWVSVAGVNWGDAALVTFMSDGQVGSRRVHYRLPNRTVTIPLTLRDVDTTTFSEIRGRLQQKTGLLQREGGWIMRQIDSTALYADVVNASLHLGGSWLQAHRGFDVDAVLTLECLPEFYEDEIVLDSAAGTGVLATVLAQSSTPAVVGGDQAARCRIVVEDTSGHDQLGLIWGFRSRHYDPAATAELVYEAEALGPLDAGTIVARSGASGGTVVRHPALPAGAWCPVLSTNIGGSVALTHQGSYRVWGRAYSGSAIPALRLMWGVGDVAHPVTNDPVKLKAAGAFQIVDFGSVRLDAPPVGGMRWQGVIQALADVQGDQVELDELFFQPVDEAAGKLTAVQADFPVLGVQSTKFAGTVVDDSSTGTVAWGTPGAATAEDGSYATFTATTSGTAVVSHYLRGTACGFAIPTGGSISGIRVEIKRFATASNIAYDARVSLVKGGTLQSTNYASPTRWVAGGAAWFSYGGQTDLWGGTWTPTDLNSGGFGVALSAGLVPYFGAPVTALVDAVRVTAYYTTVGAFTPVTDAVIHSSRAAELRTEGIYRQDDTGSVYSPVAEIIGDLPRLPPSGLEETPIELLVKPTRSDFDQTPDSALDTFTIQVKYRPVRLFSD